MQLFGADGAIGDPVNAVAGEVTLGDGAQSVTVTLGDTTGLAENSTATFFVVGDPATYEVAGTTNNWTASTAGGVSISTKADPVLLSPL